MGKSSGTVIKSIYNSGEESRKCIGGKFSALQARNWEMKGSDPVVIVLDKRKRPAGFTTPRRARLLIGKGRAVIHRIYPFTIRVKDLDSTAFDTRSEYQMKIDPGIKHTGIAIVEKGTNKVCLLAQIKHRGETVHKRIQKRSFIRRTRRTRELRHRRNKFLKGPKIVPEFIPPTHRSIGDNIVNWYRKLSSLINITCIYLETTVASEKNPPPKENPNRLYRHDMKRDFHKQNNYTCVYCGGASGCKQIEAEHIISKHKGGSNSSENLATACRSCNDAKDTMPLSKWLESIKQKPVITYLDYQRIKHISAFIATHPHTPKSYAFAMPTLIKYLKNQLQNENVIYSSGKQTSDNRDKLGLKKGHCIDAVCVGEVNGDFKNLNQPVLYITAVGRGNRMRGKTNVCGIITTKYRCNRKYNFGFKTGDIVKAMANGYIYIGRIIAKASGCFEMKSVSKSFNYKLCKLIQKDDGYAYNYGKISYAF